MYNHFHFKIKLLCAFLGVLLLVPALAQAKGGNGRTSQGT
jgi:hypothetical protein